jgi:hypothetical protein
VAVAAVLIGQNNEACDWRKYSASRLVNAPWGFDGPFTA